MYELLTMVDVERPLIIVEHPSRVVFTLKKRDRELAEAILDRLNFPELIELDEAGATRAAKLEETSDVAISA